MPKSVIAGSGAFRSTVPVVGTPVVSAVGWGGVSPVGRSVGTLSVGAASGFDSGVSAGGVMVSSPVVGVTLSGAATSRGVMPRVSEMEAVGDSRDLC